MRFDEPLWLLLLAPFFWSWRRASPIAIPFPQVLAARLAATPRLRCERFAGLLGRLAAILAIVALAGPQFGREVKTESSSGIDVQLLLDVSGSMQLRDLGGNRTRLDVVRDVLDDFVAGRPGDRLGLMTFALYPRVACPLTRDHAALREALEKVKPVLGNSPEDRTAIGVAIAAASLRLSESPAKSKVLVMLTDGEQIVHEVGLDDAADFAKAHGVRLYAVAAGRAQGPWTRKLEAMALHTGGRAFFARDGSALERVYREIDALERSETEVERIVLHADVHAGFQLAALLALVLLAGLRAFVTRGTP